MTHGALSQSESEFPDSGTGVSATAHYIERVTVECGVLAVEVDLRLNGLDHRQLLRLRATLLSQAAQALFKRMIVRLLPGRFRQGGTPGNIDEISLDEELVHLYDNRTTE